MHGWSCRRSRRRLQPTQRQPHEQSSPIDTTSCVAARALTICAEAERALPWPVFPPVPPGIWEPRASIIVCVHNALDDVRRCLGSVARHLTVDAELVIVDDGSDETTASFLEAVARSAPRVRLISNPDPPHGYTIAANLGLRAAVGEYLVAAQQRHDRHRGLARAHRSRAAKSDPEIGIVGPVSNAASHQSVPKVREEGAWATNPLPEWLTVDGMGVAVAGASARERPAGPVRQRLLLRDQAPHAGRRWLPRRGELRGGLLRGERLLAARATRRLHRSGRR